jgi:peptidoglycan/LPS O-acetylase OafA/YrhL
MYVYHPIIFSFLPRHLGSLPLLAKAFLSFAAAYLVSLASYYGFEKHLMDLKARFAREKPFKPAVGRTA